LISIDGAATRVAQIRLITLMLLVAVTVAPAFVQPALAQPPANYYDSVDASSSSALRATLHDVIDDHTRFPFTSGSTDTWDIVNLADEDPNDTGNIIDVYKNASYAKIPGGVGAYNREHTWPSSYGFPNENSSNYPYTDVHHLFACDASYNSSRSNKPFRYCDAACSEKTTLFNDGRGGGSGVYPGNSNWTSGSFTQGTWETWNGRKGDVARAILYMDLRYEGDFHGVTGVSEPDLIATDNESLIDTSNTGSNESVAYMGMLTELLQWHAADPPDSREVWRNEVVYTFQGNRNPFIDHPEWVECLHNDVCPGGDVTPPGAPTGLVATPSTELVDLSWNANSESDLDGYNVYRSTTSGGPYTKVNGGLLSTASYTDTGLTSGTTYHYVVTAVDTSANESSDSSEASATPNGPGGGEGNLLLSEVLYDVSGGDDGFEWVELFNSGTDSIALSSFCLGNGGSDYTTSLVQLSGTIAAGSTFVVGGPTSSGTNANPSFDQIDNFSPDFQNSGSAGDGVALFDVACSSVTGSTVPIDAVVYGPNNNNNLIDESGGVGAPEVGDAAAGSSIERVDLGGSWQIQSSPTPNSSPLGSGPANTPPTTTITAPSDATTVTEGTAITFEATASDAEDGDLSASVSWTSDLDGALGSGGSLNATLSVGTHSITASVTDSGSLSDSDTIQVTVEEDAGNPPVTIVLTPISSEDGWVRESNENSNVGGRTNTTGAGTSALRAGDHKKDRQYKTVLSFDTSSIPEGAAIVSATLRLKRGRVTGTNPFDTHGTCWVDVQSGGFSGSTALQNADFEATSTAPQAATLSNAPNNGDWSEGSLDAAGLSAIDTTGTSQMRIYFDLDDNDDTSNDYIGWYSANNSNSGNHPQLEVTYQP